MQIPLKIKVSRGIFVGVILTKDNLAKRNWHGNKKCVFCHYNTTIEHLFFQWNFAKSIWLVIQIGYTLCPSRSVANIFCS
jgi:hypothetical protein